MKAFIDKIFKAKKQKELLDDIVNTKVIEENKKILSEQIETSIKKHIEKVEEVKEVEKHNPSNIGPGI
jgi:alpha-tubulin suppressor-like RCC1 family protein